MISSAATATVIRTVPATAQVASPAPEADARLASEEAATKYAATIPGATSPAETATSPATEAVIKSATATIMAARRPAETLRAPAATVTMAPPLVRATPASLTTEPVVATMTVTPPAESATPLPAVFAHLIATPTAFGAVAADAEATCAVAEGWLPYKVREGDSLLALALASGSNLIDLREGNCFGPVTGIIVGESIALPSLLETPLAPAAPLFPVADTAYQVVGCDSTLATILEPQPMTELQGIFALRGSARIPVGGRYRISVKPAWSPEYHRFLEVERSVRDDVIGLINTEIFGPGLQRLRLETLDGEGEIMDGSLCEIPVVFKES